jgi:hypothetical protein
MTRFDLTIIVMFLMMLNITAAKILEEVKIISRKSDRR